MLDPCWSHSLETKPHAAGGLRIADPKGTVLDIVQMRKLCYDTYKIFITHVGVYRTSNTNNWSEMCVDRYII
jgi:hypothetical protein